MRAELTKHGVRKLDSSLQDPEIGVLPVRSSAVPMLERRAVQFFVLALSATAAALGGRALNPLQETMQVALSLTDNQIALLQGPAAGLPVVLAAVPLGFLIDRYSRISLLFVFLALNVVGSVLTSLAASFSVLFLARCMVGLAVAAIIITGFSLLADLYPPAQRGRAKAVLVLGQYGGVTLAFALGGALLSIFESHDGWRWALFWLTAPALILVMLLMIIMREPARTGVIILKPSPRQALAELWRLRALMIPLILGVVMAEIPLFAIGTWAAPTLTRNFNESPERVGAIMGAAMMVSGILGPIIGGTLADVCQRIGGPRRTVLALSSLALLTAPLCMFGISPTVWTASALLVLCITSAAATLAMGVTLFTIVIPNELRGLCLAVLTAANSLLAVTFAPLAVSVLSGAMGGPHMIGVALSVVSAVASVLGALLFALGRRYLTRPALS